MFRPLLLAAGTAAVCVAASACTATASITGSSADPLPPGTVVIAHFSFIPATVTVKAGQTVTWHFDDHQMPYNVVFDGGQPASPIQISGSWSHRFDTPGTYHYRSTVYERGTRAPIEGTVVVTG